MSNSGPIYLTSTALAERLGVREQTVRKWRLTGRGPAYHKLAGTVRYLLADVQAWEASGRRDPSGRGGAE